MKKTVRDILDEIISKVTASIKGKLSPTAQETQSKARHLDPQDNQLTEREELQKYADVTKQKIISSQADLDIEDLPVPEMLSWCKEQGNILVMDDGSILTSRPTSRLVQNCKVIMLHKGIHPGRVRPATTTIIQVFLATADEKIGGRSASGETVSVQQQRLRMLVRDAIQEQVSDIHIEVRAHTAKIRFRRHGEMYLQAEWLPTLAREVASVAFNKETDYSVTHFNPLVPQNASMPLFVDARNIRLRLASMPAHGGFDIVMRVLATGEERIPTLQELGYTKEHLAIIQKASGMPHGGIIVSGPTGSGKTTTLASCISMISSDKKIYTIEDPVEKVVEKATQVPVNEDQEDRTFSSLGRASLRMDPDVIVLGEMRDQGTAEVMMRASMTGHLVYSTLHTNTATGIVTRLSDMGISPVLLGDTNLLVCLISQRLMPVLCKKCAISVTNSPDHKDHLDRIKTAIGDDLSNVKARGKLCHDCRGLGIQGRTVIAEVIWIDDAGRKFIKENDNIGWTAYLIEKGWKPYTEHALDLVRQGIVDPLDAEKVIGSLDSAFRSKEFDYRAVE